MKVAFTRCFVTSIIFIFLIHHANGQLLQDSLYTKAEIIEDLTFLEQILKNSHPALYEYQTELEMNERFQEARNQVRDTMTDHDMLNLLAPIIKPIGCGHTTVANITTKQERKRRKKLNRVDTLNFLPFSGKFIGTQLFVGNVFDPTLSKNTEVLMVDGHSTSELLQKLEEFPPISEDGTRPKLSRSVGANGLFSFVYRYFYPIGQEIIVRLKTDEQIFFDTLNTLKAKDIPRSSIEKYEEKNWKKIVLEKPKKASKTTILYSNRRNPDLAVLEIKRFNGQDEKALSKIFKYLNQADIQNLAIDLRGNGGGSINLMVKLLSHTMKVPHTFKLYPSNVSKDVLRQTHRKSFINRFFKNVGFAMYYKKKREGEAVLLQKTINPAKKNRFTGNLYVLIDHGSFSASSMYSSVIQYQKRGVFIGEETGGAKDVTNGARYFYPKLPNSRGSVRIPQYRIKHQVGEESKGQGILPDFKVRETVESYKNGEDLILKKLLKVVEGA
ncbi:MAG: S41 family peptidase [Bacteroidota bacterium]